MGFRLNLVSEMLYAAALLTALTAAPDILIKHRLNYVLVSSVSISYPGVRIALIRAFLLTALAMWPTLRKKARRRLYNLLALAPWILSCSLRFLLHVRMHLFAIRQVNQFGDSKHLILALAIYCIFFAMAVEMMLHWIAIAHMSIPGNVLKYCSKIK
ncbi:hypothetical protein KR054_008156 [Drosophila jambulina]|nr:hypothetical protein KR054_008156 [Drosophila jambulina]